MDIEYKLNCEISTEQFIDLLRYSTLGERRPVDNYQCINGMIKNSNLVVSAWLENELIGVARSLTDFHYACYVSDLAVNKKQQKNGVGKKLLKITQEQLGSECKLILVSAPEANTYYEHIGFTHNDRCWILDREKSIR